MTAVKDLDPWPLFEGGEVSVLAIGWLDPALPFAKGPVSREFFAALVALLVNPWQPVAMAGWHDCPFCRFTTGLRSLRFENRTADLGISNVYVPGQNAVYVAPSLIAHYIDAHDYQPPEIFVEAVLACPEMRSMAYLKALRALGYSSSK